MVIEPTSQTCCERFWASMLKVLWGLEVLTVFVFAANDASQCEPWDSTRDHNLLFTLFCAFTENQKKKRPACWSCFYQKLLLSSSFQSLSVGRDRSLCLSDSASSSLSHTPPPLPEAFTPYSLPPSYWSKSSVPHRLIFHLPGFVLRYLCLLTNLCKDMVLAWFSELSLAVFLLSSPALSSSFLCSLSLAEGGPQVSPRFTEKHLYLHVLGHLPALLPYPLGTSTGFALKWTQAPRGA